MTSPARHARRSARPGPAQALRSEAAKLSWRSPAIAVAVPLAILIPVLVNYAIAEAANQNKIDGSGGLETSNAAYWILVFSTFILMAGAVFSTSAEFNNGTVDLVFARQPRRWMFPVAKAAVFGAIAAATSAVAVVVLMVGFPLLYPDIWGKVDILSGEGLRLWVGIPVYLMLVTLLGVGLATLFPKPGLILMLVLLWRFGVETFFTFIRGDFGLLLQRFSPFRNAELGVGQLSTFTSPFGGANGSLAYFGLICVVVYGAALYSIRRRDIAG